jgi:hypothetical protein
LTVLKGQWGIFLPLKLSSIDFDTANREEKVVIPHHLQKSSTLALIKPPLHYLAWKIGDAIPIQKSSMFLF